MKILISAVLIFGIATTTYGLNCYICSDTDGLDGEAPATSNNLCYFAPVSGTTTSNGCGTGEYCRTHVKIIDGVTTGVTRACVNPTGNGDHDSSEDIPTIDVCITALSGADPVDTTDCYFPCNTDNCNTEAATAIVQCSAACNNGGTCDYLTGNCVCTSSFTGSNCDTAVTVSTATTRQCVQCNSETDSTCGSSTTMANCPAGQQFCSTTTTVVYSTAGTAVKTVTSRGCTGADGVVDECAFTDIFNDVPLRDTLDYNEITCRSVCNSDGCNTNTANGVVDGNEAIRMFCVVCTDTDDEVGNNANCATKTTREMCPSGTTHCKATVSYFISNVTDIHSTIDPVYSIQSITRECATAAVTAECTETTMATITGVKRVTCTETCTEDGCNTGWPARPKCVTCSTTDETGGIANYVDGYDECLENPPDAAACLRPFHEFCGVREYGRMKSTKEPTKRFRHRIIRECTAFDYGGNCTTDTRRGMELENCNYTCTTDSCNEGSTGSRVVQTMIAVLIPAILGWLMQNFL